MVHGGRGFLDIGVCDRQSKTSDASYEWRLANVITSVASSAFCVKSSQVSRHLPNRLKPERTPHYHFIGSPHLPEQKERKEPANPSTQQPPTIENTHLGNPLDTESVIIEILNGAESIARNDLQIPMPYESYTNQNHQRSCAIFTATVPQAHRMINDVLLIAAIPPDIRNDNELVTAMITKRCIEELDNTDWIALVEAIKKVISQEPER